MEEELFDFDAGEMPVEQPVEEPSIYDDSDISGTTFEEGDYNPEENVESDYITRLLESKGIKNRTIQIEDEEGTLQDVKWDDLSDEEKYEILSDHEEPVMPEDHEIDTLNYLRQNNMSLDDFAKWQREVGVQEYLAGQQPVTEFDNYSDEEMVAYDYIQRFGEDMSDEEIDAEIERLKADPEAFEKRVALLRNAYKSEEEAQKRLYQEDEERKSQEAITTFQNAYYDAASDMNYIHGMNLDNNDKQELLNFVLAKDAAGRTGLAKALDNPSAVLQMAWYLLHGEETYDATVDHFKKEISKRSAGTRAVSRRQNTQSKDAFKFN